MEELTFSCRKCLSSLSSRYVRFDRTGVEKGFMIFLIATEVPESWSLAELSSETNKLEQFGSPDQSERSHPDWLQVDISGSHLEDLPLDLFPRMQRRAHRSEDGELDKVGHVRRLWNERWKAL